MMLQTAPAGSFTSRTELHICCTSALFIDIIPELVTQLTVAWLQGSEDHCFHFTRMGVDCTEFNQFC